MGNDVADMVGTAVGKAAREAVQSASKNLRKRARKGVPGPTGLAAGAAGAGLMALAPVAAKGAGKLISELASNGNGSLKEAGGKLAGTLKDAAPSVGGGEKSQDDGGGDSQGQAGVGKGRRMPVQQVIDIGLPLETVYNQWTQFEEWPKFMHRLQQVSQEDETHVNFKTKIWGVSKEFTAEIVEQRPEDRIKWKVTEGVTHTGVVTFHELVPGLTRVDVNLDVEPGSLLEKAARGMRHVKRAVRADLARFKAYILMEGEETGAWRGKIEEAEVKRSSSGGRRSSSGRSGSSGKTSGSSGGQRRASTGGRSRASSDGSNASSSRSKGSTSSRSRGSSDGRSRSSGGRSRPARTRRSS